VKLIESANKQATKNKPKIQRFNTQEVGVTVTFSGQHLLFLFSITQKNPVDLPHAPPPAPHHHNNLPGSSDVQ
jgi:hypothetical protein